MQKFLATPQVSPLISSNNTTESDAGLLAMDGQRHRPRGTYLRHTRDGLYQQRQHAAQTARPLLYKIFGVESKDCYRFYTDIKRRKNESRTYFLDKMQEKLNERMLRDEEQERMRR